MIVFDASTLILLARIGLLERFLSGITTTALIPDAVRCETGISGKCAAERISCLIGRQLEVRPLTQNGIPARLMNDFHIDRGEAEAIALALEIGNAAVATDDRNAIKACKLLKIPFITAPAALSIMNSKGIISRDEAVNALALLQQYGRYKASIIDDIRRRISGD